MPLQPGTRLGPYEITAAIGEGGMGEVYQARDTTLNRDVAIKVLPDTMAGDPDRLARFQREAEALAALNHPNIAQVYGLEKSGDSPAIVMELVGGPTLADRIASGAIPLDDALPIARQIAEALEAAHERGIIHRDLKPANIKVRDDGTVKVLDFGLAKAMEPPGEPSSDMANSPTLTAHATQMGMILGTAAYMAPEQAKGKTVDKRADIWAFGVVLYEMLTAERCFKGEDISETLASVLKDRPALDALPAGTPPRLRRLLERSLERDPKQRLRDIGEARIALEEVLAGDADVAIADSIDSTPAWIRRTAPWLAASVLVGLALGWIAFASFGTTRNANVSDSLMRVAVQAFPGLEFVRNPAPAPDDSYVVYEGIASGVSMLYLHDFESGDVRPLAGTEGGGNSFLSPDGRWVGFRRGADLMKLRLAGGDAIKICDARGSFPGAIWTPNNTIVFPTGWLQGLSIVSADGGEPVPLTTVNTNGGEKGHWWPRLLPDGRHALFTIWNAGGGLIDSDIAVLDLETGDYRTLVRGADAWYLPPGFLVYYHAGSYHAMAFDPATLEVTGDSIPVLEDATDPQPQGTDRLGVAISARGTLFYLDDEVLTPARLSVVAPGADPRPLAFPVRQMFGFALSPDGQKIAASSLESGVFRMHLLNLQSGIDERLDLAGTNWHPYWKHDGSGFAFVSMRKGDFDIYFKDVNADTPDQPMRVTPTDEWPRGWSANDASFFFTETLPDGSNSLKVRPEDGANEESTVIPRVDMDSLTISPDGHWMAYDDTRDGSKNVYVRPYPGPGPEVRVSPDGGEEPGWSPDGSELYYTKEDSIIAVPYGATQNRFQPRAAEVVFRSPLLVQGEMGSPLVVRARRSFIVALRESEPEPPHLNVVLNWFEELRQRVPTGR